MTIGIRARVKILFDTIFTEILVILLTITRIIVFPILLTLVVPIYAWRKVVGWSSYVFRPDLIKMVVTRSSIMAVDDWTREPRCNLVVTVGFQGELQMSNFRSEIQEKVLNRKKDENPNEELHPELKQYYETWMGFLFWKSEENFNINEHIRLYSDQNSSESITTKDLCRIEGEMSYKAFPPKKSPWEVLYIRNFKPDFDSNPETQKSLVIFRLHHGIADGYSLLNLLLKEICQLHQHEYALPNYPTKKSLIGKAFDQLRFIIKSQYDGAKQRIECNDKNEWRIPREQMSSTWFQVKSRPIPLPLLKRIKNMYSVSFTSMLIGGISGGIQKYFAKRGKPFPNRIHCISPFPVPRHTTKLRNFYSFAYLKFPIGIVDPKERMASVEQSLKELKQSTTPMLNFMQLPIVGGLCSGLIRLFAKNNMSTALMSNFPGPFQQCSFMGLPVTELGFAGGLLNGNQSIGFSMLSYLGYLNIRIIGNKSIFSDEDEIWDLLAEIQGEFQELANSAIA